MKDLLKSVFHKVVVYPLLLAAFGFSALAFAQTNPNLEVGFKPYGSYHGSEMDTVGLMAGNLTHHLRYPYHYPQRGAGLDDQFFLVMNSKSWTVRAYIPPPGSTEYPSSYWGMNDLWNPGTLVWAETLLPVLGRTYEHDTNAQANSTYSAYGY